MEIYKTYIGMMVPNEPSTLMKIHELVDGTYVYETSNGYLSIINSSLVKTYLDNMYIYSEKK